MAAQAERPGNVRIVDTASLGDGGVNSPGYPLVTTDAGVTIFQTELGEIMGGTPNQIFPILPAGMAIEGGGKIHRNASFIVMAINHRGDIVFEQDFFDKTDCQWQRGIYLLSGGKIFPLVENGEAAPGGGKFVLHLDSKDQETFVSISNNGQQLVFLSKLDEGENKGLFRGEIRKGRLVVTRIAATGEPASHGGKLIDFMDDQPLVNNGGVVLFATHSSGFQQNSGYPWYFIDGEKRGIVPGSDGAADLIFNDEGKILLLHDGYQGGDLGNEDSLALGTVDHMENIAVAGDKAPRGGGVFNTFESPMLDAAGNVAFTVGLDHGDRQDATHGVYQWTKGGLKTILLTSDLIPPGSQPPERLGSITPRTLGVYLGQVHVLIPSGGGLSGFSDKVPGMILRGDGHDLKRIIKAGDTVEGVRVSFIEPPGVGGLGGGLPLGELGFNNGQGAMNARGQFAYMVYTERRGTGIYAYPFRKAPEIAVQQPAGNRLKDGEARKSFGDVSVSTPGSLKTFTIKNTGAATLTGLAVSKSGENAGDFIISKPAVTSLEPGARTTFTVRFHPKTASLSRAEVHVLSNDKDEKSFDISVTGTGLK